MQSKLQQHVRICFYLFLISFFFSKKMVKYIFLNSFDFRFMQNLDITFIEIKIN